MSIHSIYAWAKHYSVPKDAESYFQLLKRKQVRRKNYTTRDDARQDVFDYIEMFYNPKRRHSFNERLSPVEFEMRYFLRLQSI